MNIVKVISTAYDNLKRLKVKIILFGKPDNGFSVEPLEVSPHGIDSRPIPDARAMYTTTATVGRSYVFGYVNANRKAEVGESRIYAVDTQGNLKFNIWLRADGTLLQGTSEIPAEYTNFAVLYNETKQENDKLKSTLNTLIQKWNAFVAAYVPGSPTVTGLPPTLAGSNVTANNSDFSLIKNDKIKYNSVFHIWFFRIIRHYNMVPCLGSFYHQPI